MPLFPLRARFALVLALCLAPAPAALADEELTGLTELVEKWLASPHGDYDSLSFTYWNEEGEIPVNCAHCHSEPSFVAWLGADGSEPGVIEHPGAINSPIGCASCHTSAAHALDAVSFPSGVTVDALGWNAVCTVCHQGRQSTDQVMRAVEGKDLDDVSDELSFLNIHYGVAAAVMHGSEVRGGFQYPGRDYAGRFRHVAGADTCVACHDAHSTQVEADGCLSCHRGVDDIRAIRTRHGDFDGDGDIAGGIHGEILGLQTRLYEAIRTYAEDVAGAPIVYSDAGFPYFFSDLHGTGEIEREEAIFPNRYQSWTPRLLQAAYNYQVAKKDPGGYVHNPAYMLQLLHDSLESLSEQIDIDMGRLSRP
jgi:hypothetical protein